MMDYLEQNADEKDPLLQKKSCEDKDPSVNYLAQQTGTGDHHSKENGNQSGIVIAKLPVVCILGTELCERLTFFSVTGNLVIFCTNVLEFTSADAITTNLIFVGICFFIPAFTGWLADALLGKYRIILISGLLFIAGLALLPVVALDYRHLVGKEILSVKLKTVLFLIGILLIAFGTGGLKSNVSIFGAEQVEEEGLQSVTSFFNWFYWFVNVGGFIAYSCVVYVQQEISFAIGYAIPLVSMIVAMILFVLPHRTYRHSPARGVNVLNRFIKLQWHAIAKYRVKRKVLKLPSIFDYASFKNGGNYEENEVEGAKALWRMFPIFLMSVIYGCLFSQTSNTYLLQGIRLNLQLGSFTFPAASLSLINITVILVLVPFVDRLVFPTLVRCNCKPSQLQRIGFGFVLCMGSALLAAGLEICRKRDISENGPVEQDVAGVIYNASSISVFAQIPQYFLMGSSEVFTAITGLEFTYSQSPVQVQGFTMGMYLVTNGAGFLLGSALLNIVNSATAPDMWIADEINDGHLEYFLFLLCGIMFLNILLFIAYTWHYKYANYGPSAEAEPIVQDIVGKLSSSLSQSHETPRDPDKAPLFPSREARMEARRRSYGSTEALDFEPIFPTKASKIEARRRSYGTSLSVDEDVKSNSAVPERRSKATGRSVLSKDYNRLSEERDSEEDLDT